METLGAVLSILGGILGLLAAIFTLFAGGIGRSQEPSATRLANPGISSAIISSGVSHPTV